MCRYSVHYYKTHFVCFDCRKGFKCTSGAEKCPECAGPLVMMGRDFKIPPKSNVRQWRKVERIIRETGFRFDSCGCTGPGAAPRLLSDVDSFIQRGLIGSYRRFYRYPTPSFRI
jgi:hypothetical protein